MTYNSSSSMDIISSMIWSPYQAIQQAVAPFYNRSSSPTSSKFEHLNDDCLWLIYYYLDFNDLVRCRRVCHRFLSTINDYLKSMKSLKYDCHMNGVHLRHGQYQFDILAFEFWLKHMPSIERISFEQCRIMRNVMAHCQFNLFDSMASHLNHLKELHIGRALFINQHSLSLLINSFPLLSHVTITIYNEQLLSQLINGFRYLSYLNLDESILYNYSSSFKNFSSAIRVLILPLDLKNEKLDILKSICDGNAVNLERLEIRATINNIIDDRHYFNTIGQMMTNLQWLQLDLSSSRVILDSQFISSREQQEINNNNYDQNNESNRYLNLISGIHRLINLRVLILREKDYFDDNHYDAEDDDVDCNEMNYDDSFEVNDYLNENNLTSNHKSYLSLFDDYSLVKIIKNCTKLIMLSISSSLCCNRHDYTRYAMSRKQDDKKINYLLNLYFNKQQHQRPEEAIDITNDPEFDCDCNDSSHFNNNNRKIIKTSDKLINDEQNMDSGFDNHSDMNSNLPLKLATNSITDNSLSLIDHLTKLQILRLRGVRIGHRTLSAIQNLQQLKFLRLDTIRFNRSEKLTIKKSFEDLMLALTFDMQSNNCSYDDEQCKKPSSNHRQRRTLIHLTNIPLF